jgi:hypothetical protein
LFISTFQSVKKAYRYHPHGLWRKRLYDVHTRAPPPLPVMILKKNSNTGKGKKRKRGRYDWKENYI